MVKRATEAERSWERKGDKSTKEMERRIEPSKAEAGERWLSIEERKNGQMT